MNQPMRPTSILAKRTWWWRSPPAALLLLIIFALIASSAPEVSRFVPPLRPRALSVGRPSYADVYLVRDPSAGFELIDPDEVSWDKLSRIVTQRAEDTLQARYDSTVTRRGFWFPMFETGERRVSLEPLGRPVHSPPFSPQEMRAARVVYLAWLATAGGSPELANELQGGDQHIDRLVPMGVLKNAGTIVVLAALALSLAGMPRFLRVARAKRRVRRGLCGVCRYDLRAIEPSAEGTRCPECGALWDSTWGGVSPAHR